MNRFARWCRHALSTPLSLQRRFPARTLRAIEQAVRDCEALHAGEIRFAIEPALGPGAAWHVDARSRAIELFSQLRVWDTEHNNGVLIYVLIADRAVEIVADRGVARGRVPQQEWQAVCSSMAAAFREGRYEDGAVAGVRGVAEVLARYPAGERGSGNELPDAPVIVG